MIKFDWIPPQHFRLVSGARSWGSVRETLDDDIHLKWLIFLGAEIDPNPDRPDYFILSREEIIQRAARTAFEATPRSVERVLELDKLAPAPIVNSPETLQNVLEKAVAGELGETPKAVRLNALGDVKGVACGVLDTGIGSIEPGIRSTSDVWRLSSDRRRVFLGRIPDLEQTSDDLGPLRSGTSIKLEEASSPSDQPPEPDEIILSGQVPPQLEIDQMDFVEVEIAHPDDIGTLAKHRTVETESRSDIIVMVSDRKNLVKFDPGRAKKLPYPGRGTPSRHKFSFTPSKTGVTSIGLEFHQDGSQIGTFRFDVKISETVESNDDPYIYGMTTARRPKSEDENVVSIAIDRAGAVSPTLGPSRFEYFLNCRALHWELVRVNSKDIKVSGPSLDQHIQDYVNKHLDNLCRYTKHLPRFESRIDAIALELCDLLFEPDVLRELWPKRKQIKSIKLTTWEHQIPWEVIKLKDPDTGAADDKFLCEYNQVRTRSGESPARELRLQDFHFLNAKYPAETHQPVNGLNPSQAPFSSWMSQLNVTEISPTASDFLDALGKGDFDAFHICCHGIADPKNIHNASLVLGDSFVDGQPYLETVSPTIVTHELRDNSSFEERRPIIFLNACESDVAGPLLTVWQSWSEVFLKAGAGAFVGTAWPIRDGPAQRFANAFYQALLNGNTLARSTVLARGNANIGDASWLAYKVFGDPNARLRSPMPSV